ncbi:unnamed protein product [Dibothriocephalus latus]|uniref:Uncharacterized protein n=1 Tax=Dibothriocephalus latus TaxID=60516 RepID=A0A3P7LU92_DIBLA|nr:unnamed protein product [Dibothriocephalus latus]
MDFPASSTYDCLCPVDTRDHNELSDDGDVESSPQPPHDDSTDFNKPTLDGTTALHHLAPLPPSQQPAPEAIEKSDGGVPPPVSKQYTPLSPMESDRRPSRPRVAYAPNTSDERLTSFPSQISMLNLTVSRKKQDERKQETEQVPGTDGATPTHTFAPALDHTNYDL